MLKIEKRAVDSRWMQLGSPLIATVLTLITGAVLFAALGHDPFNALYTFFVLPVSDLYGVTELGLKVTPLLLCAMGLMLCYQAKVWNIGAEGQFVIGALGGGIAALYLPSLGAASLWVTLLFGILAGMAWSALAALLKTRFAANEILTTIMLNYIALNLMLYAVHGPLKDPSGFNFPESAMLPANTMLSTLIDGYRLHVGFLIALLAMVSVWVVSARSMIGFQIKVLGEDERAAAFAGFSTNKLVWYVLLISGGLAGLAGIAEVAGPVGQLNPYVAAGYGYSAIIVVFLGRMNPVGILIASALLALTYMGGEMAQMQLGLPKSLTGLFQGMLLFFLLACDLFISYRVTWSQMKRVEV